MNKMSLADKNQANNSQHKLIDSQISCLLKCLERTQVINEQTEFNKKIFTEKLSRSLNAIKLTLNKLEFELTNKFEIDLLDAKIEAPIKYINNDINQLIGVLNSLSIINDTNKKQMIIESVNSSLDALDKSIDLVQNYKLNDEMSQILKPLEQIQRFINNDSTLKSNQLNQNSQEKLINIDTSNYKKWLLSKEEVNIEKKLDDKEYDLIEDHDTNELSYEIINKDEPEIIEIGSDDEFENCEIEMTRNNKPNETKKNDEEYKFFKDMYERPMEYWLLK